MSDQYIADDIYDALVVALVLAATIPCIVTGGTDAAAIQIALGEAGGIWPASILPDVVREHVAHLQIEGGIGLAAA